MYFYPVDGDKGDEIPLDFWDFIQKHGGVQVVGLPITRYALLVGQVYHQCFTNLCLTYDPSANEQARVRPEPLGYAYRVLYYKGPEGAGGDDRAEPAVLPDAWAGADRGRDQSVGQRSAAQADPAFIPDRSRAGRTAADHRDPAGAALAVSKSMHEIDMQVWERYLVVGQKQGQEISIWVVENDRSMIGVQADVTVKMPNGSEQNYPMPLTNASGQASLLLPAIDAPNGTIVPFKACIMTVTDTRFCIADFFVIWNTP